MSKVISVAANCEDVGKSTCVRNIAAGLALDNKKVLVIDLDPESNLTYFFGVADVNKMTIDNAIENIINNIDNKLEDFITEVDGIHLISSTNELLYTEEKLKRASKKDYVLKTFIDKIKDNYDYVIIDCMSKISMLTLNALNASDSVIIPLVKGFIGGRAAEEMIEIIKVLQKTTNRSLEIEGILFTKHDFDMQIPRQLKTILYEAHGDSLVFFRGKVVESKKVDESNKNGLNIFEYAKDSRIARNFSEVVSEIGKPKSPYVEDEDLEHFREVVSQKNSKIEVYENSEDDIRTLTLKQLVPYNGRSYESFKNPKYNKLVESIKINGLKSPILVHELEPNLYEVLAGHNRVEAHRELKINEIKAIVLDVVKREEVDFIAKIVNQSFELGFSNM